VRKGWTFGAALLCGFLAGTALGSDVVVLKGGVRIDLKQAPMAQGNNILLTRTDGTLFSVPASEVDWKATAAARKQPAARPAAAEAVQADTPAEAARATRDAPKARVKITDSDVNHVAETPEEGTGEAAKEAENRQPGAHVEVADYTQDRSGGNLVVRGSLRNVGQSPANNVTMTVTALDEKGQSVGTSRATLAKGLVEPGGSVAFTANVPVGDKVPRSIQFYPLWTAGPAPSAQGNGARPAGMAAGESSPAPSAPAPRPSAPPAPAPTPYGRGLLWAPGAPPASDKPPADGTNGYLPGAARPEDQPKPPQ
jgi:hypothetical protein